MKTKNIAYKWGMPHQSDGELPHLFEFIKGLRYLYLSLLV